MRLLTFLIVLLWLASPGTLLAGDLILADDPPQSSYPGYGLLFLALSGASFAYSSVALTESEEKLAQAKEIAAGAGGDTAAQDRANATLDEARSAELRANVAVYGSVIFLLSSYFSFFPGHLPDNTVLTAQGIAYQYRF